MLKTEKDYYGGHYVEPKKSKDEVVEEVKELTEEEKFAAQKKAEDEAIEKIIERSKHMR